MHYASAFFNCSAELGDKHTFGGQFKLKPGRFIALSFYLRLQLFIHWLYTRFCASLTIGSVLTTEQ